MSRYQVEKGVPPPNGRHCVYPWPELEVGDSFLVKDRGLPTVYSAASAASKRYKRKFTARKMDDGVRVLDSTVGKEEER